MQSRAVPRLELVRQGVPDRSGKNPFTRQPLVISGRKEKRSLLEIEVRENRVETWSSDENGVERRATSEFATNDQAQAAYVARVSRAVRKGFHEVGECEVLGTGARHGGSLLLLDELFAAGDERVTDEGCAGFKSGVVDQREKAFGQAGGGNLQLDHFGDEFAGSGMGGVGFDDDRAAGGEG